MSATAVHRPIGVSVIAVIAIIQGIIAIVAGIGFVVERNNNALLEHIDRSSGTIATYGVSAIIWGALALLVGFALWGGANWARILVAILQGLYLAGGVYLLFAWNGYYLWQGIWQIIVAAVVLWLLFNPRADEFFDRTRTV
ncbi:MAG TPA: hypothetical protein VH950_04980 [Gaiellaceae bacterium]